MSEKSIKVQRKESILVELLNEALSTLNDQRLNSLQVLDVVCSRGASDAKVYLEKSILNEKEQKEVLNLIVEAKKVVKVEKDKTLSQIQKIIQTKNFLTQKDGEYSFDMSF